jgi:hypothetical protein
MIEILTCLLGLGTTFITVVLFYLLLICGGYLLLGTLFSKGTNRVTPDQVDAWTNNNM